MDRTKNFNKENYGLVQLRLDQWGGFLFLCFDNNAESLETFLGDLPQLMQPYDLDRLTCTRRQEYSLKCNWKIYIENAMESYHVPWVHNKTIQKQKRDHNPPILPINGEYSGLLTRHKGSRALLPGMEGFPYIPTLTGDSAEGTYYILINPSTMLGCTLNDQGHRVASVGAGHLGMFLVIRHCYRNIKKESHPIGRGEVAQGHNFLY
jgi:phenylpropionate dioxygenase-like ring-hydroxylating dioxygenase large terminal subunit